MIPPGVHNKIFNTADTSELRTAELSPSVITIVGFYWIFPDRLAYDFMYFVYSQICFVLLLKVVQYVTVKLKVVTAKGSGHNQCQVIEVTFFTTCIC